MKLDTKKTAQELVKNKGRDASSCQKIIGSETNVTLLADHWSHHADLYHLIATDALMEFMNIECDYRTANAFKLGLMKIPEFMRKCLQEQSLPKATKQ